MSYDFNIDEVFEMAEHIERNGANFYRRMAEKNSDFPVRQLFIDLAAMEDEHEKVFVYLRADLSNKAQKPTLFDPEGEAALYLRALADLRVFDKKIEEDFILTDYSSEQEKMAKVFLEAINREKESIAFYVGMKELVPENLGKNEIDGIIKEEMKHIRLLSNKFGSLKK